LAGCANEFAGVSQPSNIGNITGIKTLCEREIKVFILSVSYFLLFGSNAKMKSHQSLTTRPTRAINCRRLTIFRARISL
jgi:hypothetical protein